MIFLGVFIYTLSHFFVLSPALRNLLLLTIFTLKNTEESTEEREILFHESGMVCLVNHHKPQPPP